MKIDLKLVVIIVLVAVIGILVGILIGQSKSTSHAGNSPSSSVTPAFAPSDDGKLAKEYKEKVVVKTIFDHAKDIQKCYLDLLEDKPKISEGLLDILLKVEEDGSISSVKVTKNEFDNSEMAECVSTKIKSYYLAPPPYGINRYISHTLAFKSEETAKREAKERQEKNKPPQVIPVNK